MPAIMKSTNSPKYYILIICLAIMHLLGDCTGCDQDDYTVNCAFHPVWYILPPVAAVGVYRMMTDYLGPRAGDDREYDCNGVVEGEETAVYGDSSSGKAALLIHGFIGGPSNFGDLPGRLTESGWCVYVLRLPGHGTRSRDLIDVTAEMHRKAVADFCDSLRAEFDSLALVGHSMGGTLSLLTAAEHPVDCLVLAAPYLDVTRKWYYLLPPETWISMLEPVVQWTYKSDNFIQLNRREAVSDVFSYDWVPMQAFVTLRELGDCAGQESIAQAVLCPTLIIHAKHDQAADPASSQRLIHDIGAKDKEIMWLNQSNHHLFYDYDREYVISSIVEFLETHVPVP